MKSMSGAFLRFAVVEFITDVEGRLVAASGDAAFS
jgi:hypothetical protein